MNPYIILTLIVCCVAKAALPGTQGWESAILFSISGGLYYSFLHVAPKAPAEIGILVESLKAIENQQDQLRSQAEDTKKLAEEAKKLMSQANLGMGFQRRDQRKTNV